MSRYDGATIEIINWDKYNPRFDSKKPNWFRVENTLATGPGFYGLDCETRWLWIVILSLVSQKNGKPVEWNSAFIAAVTGISPHKQDQAIETFENFVRLRVSRNVTSVPLHATDGRTDGRTDDTSSPSAPRAPIGFNTNTEHPLVSIWNKNRGSLAKCSGLAGKRKTHAEKRWSENSSEEYWTQVVVKMARSKFCRGEVPAKDRAKPWRATFDFLIRPDTHLKVLEGAYDDGPTVELVPRPMEAL